MPHRRHLYSLQLGRDDPCAYTARAAYAKRCPRHALPTARCHTPPRHATCCPRHAATRCLDTRCPTTRAAHRRGPRAVLLFCVIVTSPRHEEHMMSPARHAACTRSHPAPAPPVHTSRLFAASATHHRPCPLRPLRRPRPRLPPPPPPWVPPLPPRRPPPALRPPRYPPSSPP